MTANHAHYSNDKPSMHMSKIPSDQSNNKKYFKLTFIVDVHELIETLSFDKVFMDRVQYNDKTF